MGQTIKIEKAYEFICNSKGFTLEELQRASGWTYQTAEKSLWKIGDLVEKHNKIYIPMPGFKKKVSLEHFKEAFSQSRLRKRTNSTVNDLLEKSKNSVLSAVQFYNNPLTTFRTETFIVLMTIGFTSLFHAIFEKNKWAYFNIRTSKYFALEKSFDVFRAQKESKVYDKTFLNSLDCLFKYFKNARDLIEHYISDIDDYTYGHCQSWLFCYEHLLQTEFGKDKSLNTLLASAIQFSTSFTPPQTNEDLDKFHKDFYSSISSDIQNSPYFKLKIRIIPYQSISDEDLRQTAIFISDPEIAAKYAETEKAIFVAQPKDVSPSEMVKMVKPIIISQYGEMVFGTSHLAKIAGYMGWVKERKIVNNTFMKNIKTGIKTYIRHYKEGAERKIAEAMKDNPDKFLKSFAAKKVYEGWKNG